MDEMINFLSLLINRLRSESEKKKHRERVEQIVSEYQALDFDRIDSFFDELQEFAQQLIIRAEIPNSRRSFCSFLKSLKKARNNYKNKILESIYLDNQARTYIENWNKTFLSNEQLNLRRILALKLEEQFKTELNDLEEIEKLNKEIETQIKAQVETVEKQIYPIFEDIRELVNVMNNEIINKSKNEKKGTRDNAPKSRKSSNKKHNQNS